MLEMFHADGASLLAVDEKGQVCRKIEKLGVNISGL